MCKIIVFGLKSDPNTSIFFDSLMPYILLKREYTFCFGIFLSLNAKKNSMSEPLSVLFTQMTHFLQKEIVF